MAKAGPRAPKKAATVKPDRPVDGPFPQSPPKRAVKQRVEVDPERQDPKASAITDDKNVHEDLQAIFGENLRAARLKGGLRQSEVARRTGFTQQYLSVIEAGHQNITLRTMSLLAKVVGYDVADMLRKAFVKLN